MQVQVNGESTELASGTTVADLLLSLELNPRQVAVEINRDLVPREEHAKHNLADGDQIEVVTFVGGG